MIHYVVDASVVIQHFLIDTHTANADAIQDLQMLPIYVEPAPLLLQRALEIGIQHQLAVYDSTYIALAERLGYPFVTVDARQEQAARGVGLTVNPIPDF